MKPLAQVIREIPQQRQTQVSLQAQLAFLNQASVKLGLGEGPYADTRP